MEIQKVPAPPCDKEAFILHVDTHGIEYSLERHAKCWTLCVEFAKALPFFKKLPLNDQV
jgi:hypothetical protein